MKIVLFHPVRLPPANYGGVERMTLWLAQGLIERGHEVFIAALEGSRLPHGVQLLGISPHKKSARALAPQLPAATDVVHFMAPPESGAMESLACPSLLTVHGNGKEAEVFPKNSVFLCSDHARRHGAQVFVYNGVHPAECTFNSKKLRDFLFLSKTNWSVKNLRGAIRLARLAGEGLIVAGGQQPWGTRIAASFRKDLKWVGPVAGARKAEVLAQAKALLFPVLWPEPFGLVVVESLLSGTPVLASSIGSLPELITPETGVLLPLAVTREAEELWIEAIHQVDRFSPEACRDWAMSRFLYSHMAEGYEALYKRVIGGESLHSQQPVASKWRVFG